MCDCVSVCVCPNPLYVCVIACARRDLQSYVYISLSIYFYICLYLDLLSRYVWIYVADISRKIVREKYLLSLNVERETFISRSGDLHMLIEREISRSPETIEISDLLNIPIFLVI